MLNNAKGTHFFFYLDYAVVMEIRYLFHFVVFDVFRAIKVMFWNTS